MITRNNSGVNLRSSDTTGRPPTVAEFLRINPLPAELRHLEKFLRKLPSVEMLMTIMLGCLEYDMSNADLERIITDVGTMYGHKTQRCAACYHWTDKFHAIVTGRADRFCVVPMCDGCVVKFEAGSATPQMKRNLDSYAGEVGK